MLRNISRQSAVCEISTRINCLAPTNKPVSPSSRPPVVTQRFYNRYQRTTFSDTLRSGLGLGTKKDGKLVPMRRLH